MFNASRSKKYKFIIINFLFLIIIIFILYDKYDINFPSFTKYNNGDILNYPIFQIDEYKKYFNEINTNSFSYIYWNQYKIENIFLLIVVIPFLKKEIHLKKNNCFHNYLNEIFNLDNNRTITIRNNSIIDISKNCWKIFHYNWEHLPSKNITNYVRHILFNYYTEDCLHAYEESLNINVKNYFHQTKVNLDNKIIKDLLSKNYKFLFIIIYLIYR